MTGIFRNEMLLLCFFIMFKLITNHNCQQMSPYNHRFQGVSNNLEYQPNNFGYQQVGNPYGVSEQDISAYGEPQQAGMIDSIGTTIFGKNFKKVVGDFIDNFVINGIQKLQDLANSMKKTVLDMIFPKS